MSVDWKVLRERAIDLDSTALPPTPPEQLTLEELKRLPLGTLQELVRRGGGRAKTYWRYVEALTAVRHAQQQAHALTQPPR